MATSNNLFIPASPIVQRLILTSGLSVSAHISLESLSSRICAAAERLSLSRDYTALSQVADVLSGLPTTEAQAASLFYRAIIERSKGREESAARLFEGVLSATSAPKYQARALQALGIIHRVAGDSRAALRLYSQSIERATGPCTDLLTIVNATLARSEFASLEGDHQRALDELRAVKPAVEIVAKAHPVYAPMFANEVAFELLQTGRIEDARRFALYALASPFAPRFPNWIDTAREIEEAREAKASPSISPAVQQARKTSPRPKLRLVKRPSPAAFKLYARRRARQSAVIRPEQPRGKLILQQISLKVRIRAPSPAPLS